MKKFLLSFGMVFSLIMAGCTLLANDNEPEADYKFNQELPLHLGNSWVYQVTRYDGFNSNEMMTAMFIMTDIITNVETKDDFFIATVQSEHTAETLVEVQGDYPVDSLESARKANYWLIVDGNRILRQEDQLNLADLESQVLVQVVFPIQINSQWALTNGKDAPLTQKVTHQGSVTVPAGTFENCFFREGTLGGMTFEDWFCPGIGVVWSKAEHQGTPFGNMRELVSYNLK